MRTHHVLVEDVIDLTVIREEEPGTTERVTPLSLSPAGGILLSLEEITRPAVEARIAGDNLSARQREVLDEILRKWNDWAEMRRLEAERAAALAASRYSDSDGIPLERNASRRPVGPNPYRNLVWVMEGAAGMLALVWLAIRWRARMHQHA